MVNQPTVRRRSTSGLRTDRPGPPRSTARHRHRRRRDRRPRRPAGFVDGSRSRRRASSISLVPSRSASTDSRTRSSAPGVPEPSVATRRVALVRSPARITAFQDAGWVASAAQRCDHSRQGVVTGCSTMCFARQALAECGEDVGEQDVARRVVAHDPVHTDREVARTTRHATNIRGGQRRADKLATDLLIHDVQHRFPLLRASRRDTVGKRRGWRVR